MKEHMMEAIKRKKFQKQYESDSEGEHSEGQSAKEGDQELAPEGGMSPHSEQGSHSRDALLGHPPEHPALKATRPADLQGETQLGKEIGFDHESHGSPANSKNLFIDTKKDPHDPVDLNRHRNMAGDGSNPKYDNMGVDEHVDVRKQASKLTGKNAIAGEAQKRHERGFVKSKMDIASKESSAGSDFGRDAGTDSEDAVKHNSLQAGFGAPQSKVNRSGSAKQGWDMDEEGANGRDSFYKAGGETDHDGDEEGHSMKSRMTGFKSARAKLDGFLSKMKKS